MSPVWGSAPAAAGGSGSWPSCSACCSSLASSSDLSHWVSSVLFQNHAHHLQEAESWSFVLQVRRWNAWRTALRPWRPSPGPHRRGPAVSRPPPASISSTPWTQSSSTRAHPVPPSLAQIIPSTRELLVQEEVQGLGRVRTEPPCRELSSSWLGLNSSPVPLEVYDPQIRWFNPEPKVSEF